MPFFLFEEHMRRKPSRFIYKAPEKMIDIQGNARVPTNFPRALRYYNYFRSWFPFCIFLLTVAQIQFNATHNR